VGRERRHNDLARIDDAEHCDLDDAEHAAHGSLPAHGYRLELVELERGLHAAGGQPLSGKGRCPPTPPLFLRAAQPTRAEKWRVAATP
jgi:hypothetical protein